MFTDKKFWFFTALVIQVLLIINEANADELIMAQIIFRHGDRSISGTFKGDPNGDEKFWPEGYGELSNKGKMAPYKLGIFFRERYKNLLVDGRYSSKKVHVESSDADRTIMSAQTCMAGLFPPKGDQIWNEELPWQPVAVHSIPNPHDYYIAGRAYCKRFDTKKREHLASLKLEEKHAKLIDYIKRHTDYPFKNIRDAHRLHDILQVEHERGMNLAPWTHKIFYNSTELKKLMDNSFTYETGTPLLSRLMFGHLLKKILDTFKDKSEEKLTPNHSMRFFSAHDLTIASVLNILGLYKEQPPYAAALIFELYKANGNSHYIKLKYRINPSDNDPPALNIPRCGTKCKLSTLYREYDEYLPKKPFGAECD